ncbi:hypothetical protein GCM10010458_26050 [Microbacterium luteolum]
MLGTRGDDLRRAIVAEVGRIEPEDRGEGAPSLAGDRRQEPRLRLLHRDDRSARAIEGGGDREQLLADLLHVLPAVLVESTGCRQPQPRAHRVVPRTEHFEAAGGEGPQAMIRAGQRRTHEEGRLRLVELASDGLHRLGRQRVGIRDERERVSREGSGGEHVDPEEGHIHRQFLLDHRVSAPMLGSPTPRVYAS